MWYVSTHTYAVSENTHFSAKAFLILLMSTFFCKKSAFFGKNSTFTQRNSVKAVLEIFCCRFLNHKSLLLQTIRPKSGFRIAPNWLKIGKTTMTSQLANMTLLPNFFDAALFLLSSLINGPSFMSISSFVLKFWQFSFTRDWLEIRKSQILPSKFCSISGDWGKLGIPNLAKISLIKCYWMLQNPGLQHLLFLSCLGKINTGVKLPLNVLITLTLW